MQDEVILEDASSAEKRGKSVFTNEQFKALSRIVSRDLNKVHDIPHFHRFTKEQVLRFLKDPYRHERQLREACIDIYASSSQFRRLIQYFVSLTDLSYVIVPTSTKASSISAAQKNVQKVMSAMDHFQVKSQFRKILTVCMREDVFYGTIHQTADSISIQQLPSDYCHIASSEGNVYNVTFDFSYFDGHKYNLPFYPVEFEQKYNLYTNSRANMRYQELDSPTSFAIKCSSDIGNYALPPFAGILPEVYDLDGYKAMKLTRTELDNYAILVMKLGLNSDGTWEIDFDKAVDFWSNLDGVLPASVGSVLSPMSVEKITFDQTTNPESTAVSEAIEAFYSSAGVSSLMFNSDKASSNALLLSIKADQDITYGIVLGIQDMVNRFIQEKSYGRNFKVTFLNTSTFNRNEVADQYLKMVNLGMPMVSYAAAAYGMTQSEMMNMNYLEDTLLGIKEKFVPLQTASTLSSAETSGEAGRPETPDSELTEQGEAWRERDEG